MIARCTIDSSAHEKPQAVRLLELLFATYLRLALERTFRASLLLEC